MSQDMMVGSESGKPSRDELFERSVGVRKKSKLPPVEVGLQAPIVPSAQSSGAGDRVQAQRERGSLEQLLFSKGLIKDGRVVEGELRDALVAVGWSSEGGVLRAGTLVELLRDANLISGVRLKDEFRQILRDGGFLTSGVLELPELTVKEFLAQVGVLDSEEALVESPKTEALRKLGIVNGDGFKSGTLIHVLLDLGVIESVSVKGKEEGEDDLGLRALLLARGLIGDDVVVPVAEMRSVGATSTAGAVQKVEGSSVHRVHSTADDDEFDIVLTLDQVVRYQRQDTGRDEDAYLLVDFGAGPRRAYINQGKSSGKRLVFTYRLGEFEKAHRNGEVFSVTANGLRLNGHRLIDEAGRDLSESRFNIPETRLDNNRMADNQPQITQVQVQQIGGNDYRVVLTLDEALTWEGDSSRWTQGGGDDRPSILVDGRRFYLDLQASRGRRLVFVPADDRAPLDFLNGDFEVRVNGMSLGSDFFVERTRADFGRSTFQITGDSIERLDSGAAQVVETTVEEVVYKGKRAIRVDVHYSSPLDLAAAGIKEDVGVSVTLNIQAPSFDQRRAMLDRDESKPDVLSFFYVLDKDDPLQGKVQVGTSIQIDDFHMGLGRRARALPFSSTGLSPVSSLAIDTRGPIFTGDVGVLGEGKDYQVGDSLRVVLDFDEPLVYEPGEDGEITISMQVGGRTVQAQAVGVSDDGRSLIFEYIVEEGLYDGDGIEVLAGSLLSKGGARLLDVAGNTADLDLVSALLVKSRLPKVRVDSVQHFYFDPGAQGMYSGALAPFPLEDTKPKSAKFSFVGSTPSLAKGFVLKDGRLHYAGDGDDIRNAFERGDKLSVTVRWVDGQGVSRTTTRVLGLRVASVSSLATLPESGVSVARNSLLQQGARLFYVGLPKADGKPATIRIYEGNSDTESAHFKVNEEGFLEVLKPYAHTSALNVDDKPTKYTHTLLSDGPLKLRFEIDNGAVVSESVTVNLEGELSQNHRGFYFVSDDGLLYRRELFNHGGYRNELIGDTGIADVRDIARDEYGRLWALTEQRLYLVDRDNANILKVVDFKGGDAVRLEERADGSLAVVDLEGNAHAPKGVYGFELPVDPGSPVFYFDPSRSEIGESGVWFSGGRVSVSAPTASVVRSVKYQLVDADGNKRDVEGFQLIDGRLSYRGDRGVLNRARVQRERLSVVIEWVDSNSNVHTTEEQLQLRRNGAPRIAPLPVRTSSSEGSGLTDKVLHASSLQLSTVGSRLMYVGFGVDDDRGNGELKVSVLGEDNLPSRYFEIKDGYLVVREPLEKDQAVSPVYITVDDGKTVVKRELIVERYDEPGTLIYGDSSTAIKAGEAKIAVSKFFPSRPGGYSDIHSMADELQTKWLDRIKRYSPTVRARVVSDLRDQGIEFSATIQETQGSNNVYMPSKKYHMKAGESLEEFIKRGTEAYGHWAAQNVEKKEGNIDIRFMVMKVEGALTNDIRYQMEERAIEEARPHMYQNYQTFAQEFQVNLAQTETFTEGAYWGGLDHADSKHADLNQQAGRLADQLYAQYAGYSEEAQLAIMKLLAKHGVVFETKIKRVWELKWDFGKGPDAHSANVEESVSLPIKDGMTLRSYLHALAKQHVETFVAHDRQKTGTYRASVSMKARLIGITPLSEQIDLPLEHLFAFGLLPSDKETAQHQLRALVSRITKEFRASGNRNSPTLLAAALKLAKARPHIVDDTKVDFDGLPPAQQAKVLQEIMDKELIPFYQRAASVALSVEQNASLLARPSPWVYLATRLADFLGISPTDSLKLLTEKIVVWDHRITTQDVIPKIKTNHYQGTWIELLFDEHQRLMLLDGGHDELNPNPAGTRAGLIARLRATVDIIDEEKFQKNINRFFGRGEVALVTVLNNDLLGEELENPQTSFEKVYAKYVEQAVELYREKEAHKLLLNLGDFERLQKAEQLGSYYAELTDEEKVLANRAEEHFRQLLEFSSNSHQLNDLTSWNDKKLAKIREIISVIPVVGQVGDAVIDGMQGDIDALGHDILQAVAWVAVLGGPEGAVLSTALFLADSSWTGMEAFDEFVSALQEGDTDAAKRALDKIAHSVLMDIGVLAGHGVSGFSRFSEGLDSATHFNAFSETEKVVLHETGEEITAHKTEDGQFFQFDHDEVGGEPPKVHRLVKTESGAYKRVPLEATRRQSFEFTGDAAPDGNYRLDISMRWRAREAGTGRSALAYRVNKVPLGKGMVSPEPQSTFFMQRADGGWAQARVTPEGEFSYVEQRVGGEPNPTNRVIPLPGSGEIRTPVPQEPTGAEGVKGGSGKVGGESNPANRVIPLPDGGEIRTPVPKEPSGGEGVKGGSGKVGGESNPTNRVIVLPDGGEIRTPVPKEPSGGEVKTPPETSEQSNGESKQTTPERSPKTNDEERVLSERRREQGRDGEPKQEGPDEVPRDDDQAPPLDITPALNLNPNVDVFRSRTVTATTNDPLEVGNGIAGHIINRGRIIPDGDGGVPSEGEEGQGPSGSPQPNGDVGATSNLEDAPSNLEVELHRSYQVSVDHADLAAVLGLPGVYRVADGVQAASLVTGDTVPNVRYVIQMDGVLYAFSLDGATGTAGYLYRPDKGELLSSTIRLALVDGVWQHQPNLAGGGLLDRVKNAFKKQPRERNEQGGHFPNYGAHRPAVLRDMELGGYGVHGPLEPRLEQREGGAPADPPRPPRRRPMPVPPAEGRGEGVEPPPAVLPRQQRRRTAPVALGVPRGQFKVVPDEDGRERYHVALPPRPVSHLTLAGGGAKGVGNVGILRALHKHGLADGIKTISGTSAGSMTAAIMALNFNRPQKVAELLTVPMDVLARKVFPEGATYEEKKAALRAFLGEERSSRYAIGVAKLQLFKGIVLGLRDGEAHTGEALKFYLEEVLRESFRFALAAINDKETLRNPVYLQLAEKYLALDAEDEATVTFRDLYLLSTLTKDVRPIEAWGTLLPAGDEVAPIPIKFSYETSPTASVAEAAMVSASIPGLFRNYYADGLLSHLVGFEGAFGTGRRMTDGGIINNVGLDAIVDPSGENRRRLSNTLSVVFGAVSNEFDAMNGVQQAFAKLFRVTVDGKIANRQLKLLNYRVSFITQWLMNHDRDNSHVVRIYPESKPGKPVTTFDLFMNENEIRFASQRVEEQVAQYLEERSDLQKEYGSLEEMVFDLSDEELESLDLPSEIAAQIPFILEYKAALQHRVDELVELGRDRTDGGRVDERRLRRILASMQADITNVQENGERRESLETARMFIARELVRRAETAPAAAGVLEALREYARVPDSGLSRSPIALAILRESARQELDVIKYNVLQNIILPRILRFRDTIDPDTGKSIEISVLINLAVRVLEAEDKEEIDNIVERVRSEILEQDRREREEARPVPPPRRRGGEGNNGAVSEGAMSPEEQRPIPPPRRRRGEDNNGAVRKGTMSPEIQRPVPPPRRRGGEDNNRAVRDGTMSPEIQSPVPPPRRVRPKPSAEQLATRGQLLHEDQQGGEGPSPVRPPRKPRRPERMR